MGPLPSLVSADQRPCRHPRVQWACGVCVGVNRRQHVVRALQAARLKLSALKQGTSLGNAVFAAVHLRATVIPKTVSPVAVCTAIPGQFAVDLAKRA